MKRLLLSSVLTLWLVPLALATTNYINNGIVNIVSPPQVAPQIDASNFVNNGTFSIINVYPTSFNPPIPYETWNTRNWTNSNLMVGDSGFRFDYFDSVGQTNGWSSNFQNAGNVNPTNSSIFGTWYARVAATNVYNHGTLAVGGSGLMTVSGKSLDLSRGSYGAVVNAADNTAGVRDLYWGTATNFPGTFGVNSVSSSPTIVTTILGGFYAFQFQFLSFFNACATTPCTNGFTTYITTNQGVLFGGSTSNTAYDVLFLRQRNPAISTEVRFVNSPSIPGISGPGLEKIVEFQSVVTNRVNGALLTNQLFLDDTFGNWYTVPSLLPAPTIAAYGLFSAARFRPGDFLSGYYYNIFHAPPAGYAALPLIPPTTFDPSIFAGTNFPVFSTNIAWAATLSAAAFPPDDSISGSTWTNVPGRIEFRASGAKSYLDLTRVQMNGPSYLLLSSTNHFVGSTNASITSPVSDIYLASTNGMMAISNLVMPFMPRMEGEIQVWTGRWTNVDTFGVGELYTVTMVDANLNGAPASQIQNLSLRSTNVLVGDALNVFGSLLIDTKNLTVSSNALNSPTAIGEINLTSGDLIWSGSLPTLVNLTNYGKISSVNSIFFGGSRQPPFFSGTYDEPYQSFVTHGLLQSEGNSIWATYFEAGGTNDSGIGPVTVQATTAIVTNGTFLVTDADITFQCASLLISNQFLLAGRSISLTVTNYLDDGSLNTSVDVITNQNTWTAGGGINLLMLPPQASLLATTVTNNAFGNAEVDNYWAGKDYGISPRGFVDNAALGRLILDGQDAGSLFAFLCTDPANALYVDLLELRDATATNFDGFGNSAGISLQTNFTLYYGGAVWNGKDISEQINGRYGASGTNGGQFLWVSNFNTGFFSSTNVTYTDGTVHRLNRALVTSCDIDSNANGIPNCMDPDPVPVFSSAMLALKAVYTKSPTNAVVVSWNTIPFATNYLYSSSSPLAQPNQWQLVTNFLSGATVGSRVTVTDALKTNAVRYYRVRVISP